MTVQELVELFNDMVNKGEGNRVVYLEDSSGDYYYRLYEFKLKSCKDSTAYAISYDEVFEEKLTPELVERGYNENDILEDGNKIIAFCPE